MTDTSVTPSDVFLFDRARLSQRHSTWTVAGAGAVTLGVLVGSWLIDHRAPAGPGPVADAGTVRLTAAFHTPPARALPDLPRPAPGEDAAPGPSAANPSAKPSAAEPAIDAALLDPGFVHGPAPVALADSMPLPPRFVAPLSGPTEAPAPAPEIAMVIPLPETPHDTAPVPLPAPAAMAAPAAERAPVAVALPPVVMAAAPETPRSDVASVPLPEPRPLFRPALPDSQRGPRRAVMARNTDTAPTPVAPGVPADNRSFLDKFFGALKPSNGPALAYASPEDGLFGRSAALPAPFSTGRTPYTAVYDISAHTVYMPDGSRLEAHSGLGRMLDDPRHVGARNVGPTPPHAYDLSLRESLFHGVQALRLTPVGGGSVFGRDGLLAHTFMLGPNGDSNGCVSFRDYASFLRAYQNGQVKRLVVVAGG